MGNCSSIHIKDKKTCSIINVQESIKASGKWRMVSAISHKTQPNLFDYDEHDFIKHKVQLDKSGKYIGTDKAVTFCPKVREFLHYFWVYCSIFIIVIIFTFFWIFLIFSYFYVFFMFFPMFFMSISKFSLYFSINHKFRIENRGIWREKRRVFPGCHDHWRGLGNQAQCRGQRAVESPAFQQPNAKQSLIAGKRYHKIRQFSMFCQENPYNWEQ